MGSASDELNGPSFLEDSGEGLGSDYGAEYPGSSSDEEEGADDYVGESLTEEEKEELMKEAADILYRTDQENEGENMRRVLG